jgi:hypothetical protein
MAATPGRKLNIPAHIERAAKRHCLALAEEVVAYIRASPSTPVLTGEMKAGYEVAETQNGAAIMNPSAPYWRYVEFGTHEHGRAQPHVRPAIFAVMARHREAA